MDTKHVSLLNLLDKLLEKGAVVKGDVLLSVADVDLVYLNLELLLSSIATLQKGVGKGQEKETLGFIVEEAAGEPELLESASETKTYQEDESFSQMADETGKLTSKNKVVSKVEVDEKNVEKGLAKLVLVLVDLLRKLMERQAIRRMELGTLSPDETEKIGKTFLLLDQRIEELKKVFHLEDEDLNFDLGPLGKII